MDSSTISFGEAVSKLAPSIGMHNSDTGALIAAAIQGGGVQITGAKGEQFDFLSAPKPRGSGHAGDVVVNSDFDVFKLGSGWDDLDGAARGVRNASQQDSHSNASIARSYGVEDDWRFHRGQLIEALWRTGQNYGVRYEALQVLKSQTSSTAKLERAKPGRKPNPYRDGCLVFLEGYYQSNGIPSRIEDMHESIIEFMQSRGVFDEDSDFPEETTRKNWIELVRERLGVKSLKKVGN
ncbi:MAG: hypothetical protein Q8L53_10495 [Aestuariivirga sp.]|nr:hypothetical protein [Aestuariivirga sp.]